MALHFGQRLRGDIPKASIRSSHLSPVALIDEAFVLFPVNVLQGKLSVMAVKYKRHENAVGPVLQHFGQHQPATATKNCS